MIPLCWLRYHDLFILFWYLVQFVVLRWYFILVRCIELCPLLLCVRFTYYWIPVIYSGEFGISLPSITFWCCYVLILFPFVIVSCWADCLYSTLPLPLTYYLLLLWYSAILDLLMIVTWFVVLRLLSRIWFKLVIRCCPLLFYIYWRWFLLYRFNLFNLVLISTVIRWVMNGDCECSMRTMISTFGVIAGPTATICIAILCWHCILRYHSVTFGDHCGAGISLFCWCSVWFCSSLTYPTLHLFSCSVICWWYYCTLTWPLLFAMMVFMEVITTSAMIWPNCSWPTGITVDCTVFPVVIPSVIAVTAVCYLLIVLEWNSDGIRSGVPLFIVVLVLVLLHSLLLLVMRYVTVCVTLFHLFYDLCLVDLRYWGIDTLFTFLFFAVNCDCSLIWCVVPVYFLLVRVPIHGHYFVVAIFVICRLPPRCWRLFWNLECHLVNPDNVRYLITYSLLIVRYSLYVVQFDPLLSPIGRDDTVDSSILFIHCLRLRITVTFIFWPEFTVVPFTLGTTDLHCRIPLLFWYVWYLYLLIPIPIVLESIVLLIFTDCCYWYHRVTIPSTILNLRPTDLLVLSMIHCCDTDYRSWTLPIYSEPLFTLLRLDVGHYRYSLLRWLAVPWYHSVVHLFWYGILEAIIVDCSNFERTSDLCILYSDCYFVPLYTHFDAGAMIMYHYGDSVLLVVPAVTVLGVYLLSTIVMGRPWRWNLISDLVPDYGWLLIPTFSVTGRCGDDDLLYWRSIICYGWCHSIIVVGVDPCDLGRLCYLYMTCSDCWIQVISSCCVTIAITLFCISVTIRCWVTLLLFSLMVVITYIHSIYNWLCWWFIDTIVTVIVMIWRIWRCGGLVVEFGDGMEVQWLIPECIWPVVVMPYWYSLWIITLFVTFYPTIHSCDRSVVTDIPWWLWNLCIRDEFDLLIAGDDDPVLLHYYSLPLLIHWWLHDWLFDTIRSIGGCYRCLVTHFIVTSAIAARSHCGWLGGVVPLVLRCVLLPLFWLRFWWWFVIYSFWCSDLPTWFLLRCWIHLFVDYGSVVPYRLPLCWNAILPIRFVYHCLITDTFVALRLTLLFTPLLYSGDECSMETAGIYHSYIVTILRLFSAIVFPLLLIARLLLTIVLF